VSGVIDLADCIGSDVYLNVRMPEGGIIVLTVDASTRIREGQSANMQISRTIFASSRRMDGGSQARHRSPRWRS
jgi:hypothetical protein